MTETIRYIARKIASARTPEPERRELCRWAHGCPWHAAIESALWTMARDRVWLVGARN